MRRRRCEVVRTELEVRTDRPLIALIGFRVPKFNPTSSGEPAPTGWSIAFELDSLPRLFTGPPNFDEAQRPGQRASRKSSSFIMERDRHSCHHGHRVSRGCTRYEDSAAAQVVGYFQNAGSGVCEQCSHDRGGSSVIDGTYNRRQVLAGGLMGGAAVMGLGKMGAHVRSTGAESVKRALQVKAAGSDLGAVKHVVFLMQENRSFDHYFGTMAGVDGLRRRQQPKRIHPGVAGRIAVDAAPVPHEHQEAAGRVHL